MWQKLVQFVLKWVGLPLLKEVASLLTGWVRRIIERYKDKQEREAKNKKNREKLEQAETEKEREDATKDIARDSF